MQIKRLSCGVACLLAALVLYGCGAPATNPPPARSSTPDTGTSAAGGTWGLDIDTVALDGTPVTSADFAANTLTVLNIWATWCPPCVAELPHLQAMSDAFAGKGVQIVGVLQDGVGETGQPDEAVIADANTLLADAGADYLVILPDAALANTFISTMQYFPTTFILDKDGNLVDTVVGANDAEGWEAVIHGALEKVS